MPRKKTYEEFIYEMSSVNPNVKILGQYIDAKTPIKCKCKITGTVWNPTPDNLLHGKKCPICALKSRADKRRKSHEQFINEMKLKQPNMIVNGLYNGAWEKVSCTCLICGHTDMYFPADLLFSGGCNNCYTLKISEKLTMKQDEFIAKLKDINDNIIYVGDYIKASDKVSVRCAVCGNQWSPVAQSLLQGTGCPQCALFHGEKRINKYLNEHCIKFIPQYTYDGLYGVAGGLLSYDFYLPNYNVLIEYQGEYHDGTANNQTKEDFEKQKIHDHRKRKYAEQNHIQLLEIWYWDFNNIENILDKFLTIQND